MKVICMSSEVEWFEAGTTYKAENIPNTDKIVVYDGEGDTYLDEWNAKKLGDQYVSWACNAWFREVK